MYSLYGCIILREWCTHTYPTSFKNSKFSSIVMSVLSSFLVLLGVLVAMPHKPCVVIFIVTMMHFILKHGASDACR